MSKGENRQTGRFPTPLLIPCFFLCWFGSHYQKDKWLRIFLELINVMNPQIQEAQQLTSRLNKEKFISRHFIVKLQNTKDKDV